MQVCARDFRPANAVRFSAHLVNMVRLESGHTVAVAPNSRPAGATLDDAFAHVDAAVAAWVN